jgi:hypothetical protein
MGAVPSGDARALEAVGLARRQRRILAAAPAVVASILGAAGAALLAVALSPLAPVGAVRDVEPDPGVDVDVLVILGGGAAIALILIGLAVVAAHRATRSLAGESAPGSRAAWTLGAMAGAGFGPNAVVGAGHALGRGRRDGVPSRSTLAACTVSVVAVASSITFGASVQALLDRPAEYGWSADLAIHSGGGYDYLDPDGAEGAAALDGVAGLTVAGFATLSLEDREVNTMGTTAVEGDPLVTVVDGASPDEPDEVALGTSTARELGVDVGDEVRSSDVDLRVVGIVALPAIGPIASAHPTLGQGALMTLEGLAALDQNAYPSLALIRLADGLDPEDEGPRLATGVAEAMSETPPDFASYFVGLRPSEVVALGPASRTANLLAGMLGAAAVLALALTLSASVRRRRHAYGVLSALGLDGSDLRSTVRWQLNLVTLLALLVGLPLGVASGRLAWTAFADQLGVASEPQVPIALLGVAAVALTAVANIVGEWPARSAGRQVVGVSLRED